jgi:hypothetical protein
MGVQSPMSNVQSLEGVSDAMDAWVDGSPLIPAFSPGGGEGVSGGVDACVNGSPLTPALSPSGGEGVSGGVDACVNGSPLIPAFSPGGGEGVSGAMDAWVDGNPLIPAFSPSGGEGVRGAVKSGAPNLELGAVGGLDVAAGPCGLPPDGRPPLIRAVLTRRRFAMARQATVATGRRESDAVVRQVIQSDAEVTQVLLQINGLRGLRRLGSHAFLRDPKRSRPFNFRFTIADLRFRSRTKMSLVTSSPTYRLNGALGELALLRKGGRMRIPGFRGRFGFETWNLFRLFPPFPPLTAFGGSSFIFGKGLFRAS